MIPLAFAHKKTFAVFGLARSGLAAARALNTAGAKVFLGDDNKARLAEAASQGFLVRDLINDFPRDVECLILSPGVPLTHPKPHPVVLTAQSAGARIVGDTDLFAQAIGDMRGTDCGPVIIAITGTNGKSTTTALIGHVAQDLGRPTAVGGNIGRAVFDLPVLGSDGVYSIEMSSYQIDLSPSFAADVACLLNITPDHLDRHGTIENYAAVKGELLSRALPDATLVVGVDTIWSREIANQLRVAGRKVIGVSVVDHLPGGIYVDRGMLIDDRLGNQQVIADLQLFPRMPGLHNAQNLCVAYAALGAIGFGSADIIASFIRFAGLAHRLEFVGERNGVRLINDSKATNADATQNALLSFDRIHWIAGGVAKDGGIESLAPFLSRVKHTYLVGQSAEMFAATLNSAGADFDHCGTIDSALAAALSNAVPGDVILLSPAAASQDQFKDFEARGDHFRALVKAVAP